MKIISLALNNHDSSFSVISDGKIISHFLAERFCGIKKSNTIIPIFKNFIKNEKNSYDLLVIEIFNIKTHAIYKQLDILDEFLKENPKIKSIEKKFFNHHICHAQVGFYTSPFDDALCFIFDANGSSFYGDDYSFVEIESVFLFKGKKFFKTLYKNYIGYDKNHCGPINLKNKYTSYEPSIGMKYIFLYEKMGFSCHSAGKVMGLGEYKNNKEKLQHPYNTEEWKQRVDEAYNLQQETQKKICSLIKKYSEETGIKNIILSGGVSLNCVSNFNCLKEFPNLNFHIDPICSDKEISLGSCLLSYAQKTRKIPEKITHVYLGSNQDLIDYKKYEHKKVSYGDIVNLLLDQNIIALFQGKSEIGERALGNRSLLFDPRNPNGKEIVNAIKKRENFRPFAGTILLEEASNWFDLRSLPESKYMSYAVDAYESAIEKIPAIIHANNTCRIQTITEKQNYHFYNLIRCFFEKTEIPMILNTSFNLAGKPLVETFEDAINTLKNSEIEYLYLPELEILVTIKNKRLNYQ